MKNPFDETIWEGTRRLLADEDVASLNAAATDRLIQQIEWVAADQRSRCTLLLGQPGLGKSHILARLTEHAQTQAYPIVVRRYGLPGASFRSVLRQVAWPLHSEEIAPGWSMLSDLSFGNILIALDGIDPERLNHDPALLRELPDAQEAFRTISRRLDRKLLEDCAALHLKALRARWPATSYLPAYLEDFVRVAFLAHLGQTRKAALRWLRGRDLDEDDLALLGLKRSVDDEVAAQEALAAIAVMAFCTKPLAICFDQTERLESSPEERGIDALARTIAFLREQPSLSLVFSCLKDKWQFYAAELPTSYRDRIARDEQDVIELAYPTPDEGVEIVKRRLGESIEPFVPENVHAWVDRFVPSARRLLQECAAVFWRWFRSGRKGGALLDLDAAEAVSQAPIVGDEARQSADWERALIATEPPGRMIGDDTASHIALLLSEVDLTAAGRALKPLPRKKNSKLHQRLQAGRKTVGLVFDDVVNGRSFASRTKHFLALVESGELDRLVIWRAEEVKSTWKAGTKHWAALGAHAAVTIRAPEPETLRQLTAFRDMCSALQSAGRDHHETANRVFAEVLGDRPEVGELLAALGAKSASTQTASPGALRAKKPTKAANVRDAVRSRLSSMKLVGLKRLTELLRQDLGRAADSAVVRSAVEDLEAAGVIWRLPAEEGDRVLALR